MLLAACVIVAVLLAGCRSNDVGLVPVGPTPIDGEPSSALWRQRAHGGPIGQLALHPTGDVLAVADGSPIVGMADAETLQLVPALEVRHHPGPRTASFSPDGALLATGAYGGVRVWDVDTGDLIRELILDVDSAADTVAWSPDGALLAVGRRPGRGGLGVVGFVVWHVATGELVAAIETCWWVHALAWRDDGGQLAAGARGPLWCGDSSVLVVETTTWREVVRVDAVVPHDALHWDASRAAFVYVDAGRVWSLRPSPDARASLVAPVEGVSALAIRPDTNAITVGLEDGGVHTLSSDGALETSIGTHATSVTSIAWAGAGDVVFSSSTAGSVIRHVTATGERSEARLGQGRSYGVAWSPDDTVVATGGDDGALRSWAATNGAPLAEVFAHPHGVAALAWHPSEARLATLGDGLVRLWHTDDLTLADEAWHPGYFSDADLAWSLDGSLLAAAGGVWVDVFRSPGLELSERLERRSTAIAWSPDGQRLAHGSWWVDGDEYEPAAIVDLVAGEAELMPVTGHVGLAVAWSGARIAVGDIGSTLIWDAHAGVKVHRIEFGPNRRITSLDWSPGGRFLAIGGDCDYSAAGRVCVVVWDSELDATVEVFGRSDIENTVGQVRWSRSGDLLAATDWSGNLAVARFERASDGASVP